MPAYKYQTDGCLVDTNDERDFRCGIAPSADEKLPSVVDMRMGFPPAWNQGQQKSCVGHAIARVIHYVDWTNGSFPIDGPRPSPRFIYYNARKESGFLPKDSGVSIREAVKSVNTYGVCPETECPYNPYDWTSEPNKSAYEKALLHKALVYKSVDVELDKLKAVLVREIPIVFGLKLTESFTDPEVEYTGMVPMPLGDLRGGHGMVLVGYDDSRSGFIVANSYGTRWGIDGYCVIPYEYICDEYYAQDFWAIEQVS